MIDLEIFKNIEQTLVNYFNIQPKANTTKFDYKDGILIVTEEDTIQVLSYPIEKRIILFKEYPKIEKKIFGISFKKFHKWLKSKKDDNDYMKDYYKKVEELLNKYNVQI